MEGKKRRDEEERRKVIEERELRVLVALVCRSPAQLVRQIENERALLRSTPVDADRMGAPTPNRSASCFTLTPSEFASVIAAPAPHILSSLSAPPSSGHSSSLQIPPPQAAAAAPASVSDDTQSSARGQSIPTLIGLLTSRQAGTVKEAVYSLGCSQLLQLIGLGLAAIESDGRKSILALPQSVFRLQNLLSFKDPTVVRYASLALGNLAMEVHILRASILCRSASGSPLNLDGA